MNPKLTRKLRRQRHTLALLLIALVLFGVLVAVAPLPKINYWGIDIYTFRAAAKAMALGQNPYHEPNILRFADGVTVGNIHNFIYAPYFAFTLRPLAWLPPVAASRVWFVLNLFLYFASFGLILAALRWQPRANLFLAILGGVVLFPPLRTTLIIGQSTILLLFILALSLFLLRQEHPFISGLVFSLGLFKPHLFPLLLFFLLYRRWRWLAGAGLGLVLLNLPFIAWLDKWVASAAALRTANLAVDQCFQMVSMVSLLNCAWPWPGWLFLLGLFSLVLVAIVVYVNSKVSLTPSNTKAVHQTEQIFDRRLALFLTISLLLIDHTRIADQILLLIPLLVAWRDWGLLRTIAVQRLAIFLTLFIYISPYVLDFFGPRNIAYLLPFWYIGLSGAVLGLLLLELVGEYQEASLVFRQPAA